MDRKKNGFTLVEVLAVIGILAILAMLFIPNSIKLLKNNNLKIYKIKESQLINAAKDFVYDKKFIAPTIENPSYITITQLAEGSYLSKILDTTSGVECDAFVKVTLVGENDYEFYPCIICEEYTTNNDFCTSDMYNSL